MPVLLCSNQYFTLHITKKVHGNTSIPQMQSQLCVHTHPPNEPVTHRFLAARKGGGAEVFHLTTLTIAKIYIMLLVDE
jgi:hypothetical protein